MTPQWDSSLGDVATVQNYAGLTSDSRAVAPGFLFAAFAGSRTDGARFIRDLIALASR